MNNKNIFTILTLLALCGSFLFNTRTQLAISVFLVFSLGIIHGANDIKIMRKVQSNRNSFLKLLFLYLLSIFFVGLIFLWLPKIALAVFIIISAYHFGEQHFNGLEVASGYLKYIFFVSYGLTLIYCLLYFNSDIATKIIKQIARIQINESHFMWLTLFSLIVLFLSGLLIILKKGLNRWYLEIVYLLVLYFLFYNSSLVWGFAIYFVVWHSIPSLLDQVKFLSGTLSKKSIVDYLKSSIIYWVLSLIGLFVFVYFFKENDQLFLTLFFTFLAAITFPHVLVMHKLFKD